MAPILKPRQILKKEEFPTYFGRLKSQGYHDPASTSRGTVQHSIKTIAWNPLGSLIATGATDKTIRVWNPEKPNVRFSTELKGHAAPIQKVAFNPVKDAELCSVSDDGVVKFWDVRTKACVNEVKGLGDAFTLAWAPDGSSLIVGNKSDNLFILSPSQMTPVSSHQQTVQTNHIAFCWSGQKVFVTTGDGKTRLLSYPNLEPLLHLSYPVDAGKSNEFMLAGHTSACWTAELQPNGRYLATGGLDSIIALWDTTEWLCQRTVTKLAGPVKSISFTFDGSYVVGGSEDGNLLEVTHTESGDHVHSIKTAGPCPIVSWAPTRYCLAYADVGVLRILGVETERK